MPSQKTIEEFKELMLSHYGVKLSDVEATEQFERLLEYFRLLIEIDSKEKIVAKDSPKKPELI